ncbi:MAG: glucose-6-phosphate isomerase family protein [Acidimicrobiales bacterium]
MNQLVEPFTTLLDMDLGTLRPQRAVMERRLSDLRAHFLDPDGEATAGSDADPVVYTVYAMPVPPTGSNIQSSTTVLQPGRVGREYFMTKGHFHEIRDRAEVYVGLAGTGRLVLATEDGRSAIEPMSRGTVGYVPGGWAHRAVNVGDEPLVFFAAYVGDAGHDYETVQRRGFPVAVVAGADGPMVEDNPRYGG